jgi:hypothetical protein
MSRTKRFPPLVESESRNFCQDGIATPWMSGGDALSVRAVDGAAEG